MWCLLCHYLFPIPPSFDASGMLCFRDYGIFWVSSLIFLFIFSEVKFAICLLMAFRSECLVSICIIKKNNSCKQFYSRGAYSYNAELYIPRGSVAIIFYLYTTFHGISWVECSPVKFQGDCYSSSVATILHGRFTRNFDSCLRKYHIYSK